jgi:hypothetical protein
LDRPADFTGQVSLLKTDNGLPARFSHRIPQRGSCLAA